MHTSGEATVERADPEEDKKPEQYKEKAKDDKKSDLKKVDATKKDAKKGGKGGKDDGKRTTKPPAAITKGGKGQPAKGRGRGNANANNHNNKDGGDEEEPDVLLTLFGTRGDSGARRMWRNKDASAKFKQGQVSLSPSILVHVHEKHAMRCTSVRNIRRPETG